MGLQDSKMSEIKPNILHGLRKHIEEILFLQMTFCSLKLQFIQPAYWFPQTLKQMDPQHPTLPTPPQAAKEVA